MRNKILDHIWSKQKEFNKNFVDFSGLSDSEKQRMTKEYSLHLMTEVTDLLSTVNWKIHHKSDSININRRDLVLEWIDIFKYWLSIGLLWDISPDEFVIAFDEKSALVEQRFLQEFSKTDGRPVAVCDIDGVLSDYPQTFLEFTYSNLNIDKSQIPEVSDLDLYRLLENVVPSYELKALKERYRTEGHIRYEKVNPGAVEFLRELKKRGYYIVLLTSRPFDKYQNLYLDTYIWLKANGLVFDMLLNDSKKRDKITKLTTESSVEFVIDDDPKIVKGLLGLTGLNKIYLIDKPYNQELENDKIVRVKDLNQVLEEL